MLAQAQGAFELAGLAADGGLVGLKRGANRVCLLYTSLVGGRVHIFQNVDDAIELYKKLNA